MLVNQAAYYAIKRSPGRPLPGWAVPGYRLSSPLSERHKSCALLRPAETAAFGDETEEGDGLAEGFPDGMTG
jgi:hypothetical protein